MLRMTDSWGWVTLQWQLTALTFLLLKKSHLIFSKTFKLFPKTFQDIFQTSYWHIPVQPKALFPWYFSSISLIFSWYLWGIFFHNEPKEIWPIFLMSVFSWVFSCYWTWINILHFPVVSLFVWSKRPSPTQLQLIVPLLPF